jgi:hypothetical protein
MVDHAQHGHAIALVDFHPDWWLAVAAGIFQQIGQQALQRQRIGVQLRFGMTIR